MSPVRRLSLLVALLGCLASALVGGAMLAASGLSALVILAAMIALPQPGPRTIERWRLVNLTLLIVGMILVAVRVPPLTVVSMALCLLAAHRAATATSASGLQALLLIVTLQIMLAAHQTTTPLMPVVIALLVLLAPAALAVISLSRWHSRTALIGAAAGSIGLLLAAALPPPPGPPPPREVHAVGFSRQITLGDLSPLHDDLTEILTLTLPGQEPRGTYLHGITLDRFTGEGWASTAPQVAVPFPIDLVGRSLVEQRITLAPLTEGVLLGLAEVASVEGLQGVWRDEVGTWRVSGALRPVRYTAYSLSSRPDIAPEDPGRWLALPADLDPAIRTLAADHAISGTPAQQAEHLIAWLLDDFTYTRIPAPRTARQPLSDFLFVTRTGHCEYFAAALAVLLRAQGIQSRVVNGLRGGEVQDDGSLLFRQRDAHAWVEVYLPGEGWTRLDPTPSADEEEPLPPVEVDRAVVLPPMPQVDVVAWPLGLLLVTGGLWAARRRRPIDRGLVLYRRAQRLVRRRGWAVPVALPPVAAAEWLVEQAGPAAEPMLTLAWALYRYRYDNQPEAIDDIAASLRALRALPRRG